MTDTTAETSALADQLSRNSTPYADPLARVDWERLSLDTFWLPERALSLYGLPGYERLSEGQRRSLSHFEFLNAVEAGLWLEGIFMRRIAASVHRDDGDTGDLLYHLHELREEAGHSLMFVELYQRSGLPRPPTAFPRLRLGNLVGRVAPFDSAAFWVAVLIGEEVPDRLNRFVHKHRSEVDPVAHTIARLHTLDEARHIAHAKDRLEQRLTRLPGWRRRVLNLPVQRVFRQFVRALYLPQPGLYELAGLDHGRDWARAAVNNPHRIAFIDEGVRTTLSTLRSHGFRLDWRR